MCICCGTNRCFADRWTSDQSRLLKMWVFFVSKNKHSLSFEQMMLHESWNCRLNTSKITLTRCADRLITKLNQLKQTSSVLGSIFGLIHVFVLLPLLSQITVTSPWTQTRHTESCFSLRGTERWSSQILSRRILNIRTGSLTSSRCCVKRVWRDAVTGRWSLKGL